jgi:hypothetical protein
MSQAVSRPLPWVLILALGISADAQTAGSFPQDGAGDAGGNGPTSASMGAVEEALCQFDPDASSPQMSLLDRFRATMSQQEDPDGPIDTDRPTFTPAHTVVPPGRLQFESGFTFDRRVTATTGSSVYDFPELAVRYGLMRRVELRTFWLGETFSQSTFRRGGSSRSSGVPSSMEAGFKWQLLKSDSQRKWVPTTALITSIIVPIGGSSPQSPGTVEPFINLVYGWHPTEKLTLCGSTGYLGMREPSASGSNGATDSFERYHQSLAAFCAATERTTLFYEWYVLTFTNAADNRPRHFMDGGLLYRLTPNIQLDLRAGFGLSGGGNEFFTGTGLSVRF